MNEKHKQAGVDLLNSAKEDYASRKRSSDNNLKAVCLDGANFAWKKPVSICFGKGFNLNPRKKHKCVVCGAEGGTFFINDGKAYCYSHKEAMYLTGYKLKEYLNDLKRRKESYAY